MIAGHEALPNLIKQQLGQDARRLNGQEEINDPLDMIRIKR